MKLRAILTRRHTDVAFPEHPALRQSKPALSGLSDSESAEAAPARFVLV